MPREPLEAIMLVGGKGTRLRPLTLSDPKPLLPTAGVPFLTHQLARAAECGITHVVLATSYRAEMFTDAFGDGADLGLSIDYVYESSPLGTGGGIRNAASLLRGGPDDPIVVLNGDILSAHDVPAQVDLHRKREAAGHRVPREDASSGEQPDQRRLLRLPPVGHRPDPGRPGGVGGAGDVPRPDHRRGGRDGLRRGCLLARRRHAGGVRPGLVRPGARRDALAGRARHVR